MKKIIDKVLYNTETAEQIAFYSSNYNPGDFEYFEERLYQTKKGNWFLHGEGGPSSPYTETFGNSRSGSQEIVPMDEDEVIEWLERRQLIDVLETHFGHAIEEA